MKLPDFNLPVYSSDDFTWKGDRGVTFASDLVALDGKRSFWAGKQVWNDACDIGFYVVSSKTGARVLFTYVHDDDGYDGEMQVYSSGDFTITIYND